MLNSLSVLSTSWGIKSEQLFMENDKVVWGLKIYQLENKFIFLFYISSPSPNQQAGLTLPQGEGDNTEFCQVLPSFAEFCRVLFYIINPLVKQSDQLKHQ